MRGIKLHGGAIFVEHENVTVRISQSGKCELSPVLFMNVEWELRTEPPETWDYLDESQIQALEHDVYEKVLALVAELNAWLQS